MSTLFRIAVVLAIVVTTNAILEAEEDCITSSKIVVVKQSGGNDKGDNSSPLTGTGDPPVGGPIIYVSERVGNEAFCHDADLDPFDVIDGPGMPAADYTGFAISGPIPTANRNWYDQGTNLLFRTSPGGALLFSGPVMIPPGPIRGMCFDPNRNSLWLCHSGMNRVYEVTLAGVATGTSFEGPGGPGGLVSGVTFCHDTGHLMVGYGVGGSITNLARVFYDGETWGAGIDVSSLGLTQIGITHVTMGSNGTPSIYISDMIGDRNIEIDAPLEEDCNGNGVSDVCEFGFVRGDCNDDAMINLADGVATLSFLFASGDVGCEQACDTNGSGDIDIADAVATLSFLFVIGSPPPPAPYPGCGFPCAPTLLECGLFLSCP